MVAAAVGGEALIPSSIATKIPYISKLLKLARQEELPAVQRLADRPLVVLDMEPQRIGAWRNPWRGVYKRR